MVLLVEDPRTRLEDLDRYSHLVADLDGSLIRGKVASGMGRYFLVDEAKRLHLPHVWSGWRNYKRVKESARMYGEAAGLEHFLDIVGRTGCATRDAFFEYAQRYIEEHSLQGAEEFMDYFAELMPTFISTVGSQIAADAAAEYYGCNDCIGNPVVYNGSRDGVIKGIDIRIRDGRDKLEAVEGMLRNHGLLISTGIAIGNDSYDHEILKASALAMAGPLADWETKELVSELNGLIILDYVLFLKNLGAELGTLS